MTAYKRLLCTLVFALLLACAVSGCSKYMEPPPDDVFEKWEQLADESPGHSPSEPEEREAESLADVEPETLEDVEKTPERDLPTFKVSLRMREANILAVVQALSRAAKQSIVVSPSVQGQVSINAVKLPWDQVFKSVLNANGLVYAWDGDIIRVMTLDDLKGELERKTIQKQQQSETLAMQRVEPLRTSIVRIKYADAQTMQESLTTFLTKDQEGNSRGSIQVDSHTNSLVIQAIPSDLSRLTRLVARLDRPRKQINLKAYIVETTKETARALGVQWGGNYAGRVADGNNVFITPGGYGTGVEDGQYTYVPYTNDGRPGISNNGFISSFMPSGFPSENGSGLNLGVMFGKLGGNILEAQLQALEEENKINIISSPSITTLDNQKAFTESGEKVPYQTDSSGDSGTTIKFEDAVLRLEITPHIIDETYLKLQVLIQKDEVDFTRQVSGNPLIVKKKTETTLIARDGETVVISGLSKSHNTWGEAGVPGAKDVDGLGWLFKSRDKSHNLDEFLIFITPQVLAEWRAGQKQRTLKEIEQDLERKRLKEQAESEETEAGAQ